MKKTLKVLLRTVELIFIVFCVFIGSLFFRQQCFPSEWVKSLGRRYLPGHLIFTCDSASFGFQHGLQFTRLRLYDSTRAESFRPVFSADSLSVQLFQRRITLVAAKLPRLHDSYYGIGVNSDEPGSDPASAYAAITLPALEPFELELIRPEILGVAPEKATARIEVHPRRVEARNIRIDWPDQETKMWLDGFCDVDFAKTNIVGEVRGTARQEHIRPLLVALDQQVAFKYMGGFPDTGTDGFTEVPGPVPVVCQWTVDVGAKDFRLDLDLHPDMGRYNNVRLRHVDGKLSVHVDFSTEPKRYEITVGPLSATDPFGRAFGGTMVVHGTNDLVHLEFDAHSDLEKQDTLDIIGYLNRGTLDLFDCDTPAKVTAKGIFNCDDVNIPNNDLCGDIRIGALKSFNQDLTDVSVDYRLLGSEMSFENFSATGVSGGSITGRAKFHLPIADGDEAFEGGGSIDIRNGRLVRIPVFLALTTALANNVPGIDKLINQSEARCDFTITNGVMQTENLVVEGALFCIRLRGRSDLRTGEVNCVAHCTVMKDDSVLGKYFVHPVLWPFTKLFTEFEISGTKDRPVLRNMSVKTVSDTIKKVFD